MQVAHRQTAGSCYQSRSDAAGRRAVPVASQRTSSARPGLCKAAEQLVGVGSSVPETFLTNDDLAKLVDTNDEWIVSRTGIRKRHVLGKGETLAQHAVISSKRALEMAGVDAKDVDLVLFATSSPDDVFGSACQVQADIGASKAVAFDLTAACSGFVLAMVTASQFIRAGTFKTVLVVGGDALSRFVDWRDRGTCILFGDGCGAVVMRANPDPAAPGAILGMDMGSDGAGHKHLHCMFSGGGLKPQGEGEVPSSHATYANIHMAGQDVFKFAVRTVPAVIDGALAKANLPKESVDWLVMHQANQRILDAAAQRLGLPSERVVSNLANYGNTSAASIPLALDEAVRGGLIQPGDKLAMAGFGAGLTWAGAIVRWG
ncbi:hypothetical protein HXX76_013911 [Chlamydomonas incerta]|uniref:beta-ketoacyl-[acyl-carrier-protein] synthase III n=1 Tax=Chlamydomonas incerta TaxID=51695 RepID=A0A835VQ71_CHLIN|nr:hypothetical protein HXX76_013911 [Chlamydomonas incerta]|eukprot:KAG2425157.1 hypothetical protein HXX76_013911 [Chlamydomonas incerta]